MALVSLRFVLCAGDCKKLRLTLKGHKPGGGGTVGSLLDHEFCRTVIYCYHMECESLSCDCRTYRICMWVGKGVSSGSLQETPHQKSSPSSWTLQGQLQSHHSSHGILGKHASYGQVFQLHSVFSVLEIPGKIKITINFLKHVQLCRINGITDKLSFIIATSAWKYLWLFTGWNIKWKRSQAEALNIEVGLGGVANCKEKRMTVMGIKRRGYENAIISKNKHGKTNIILHQVWISVRAKHHQYLPR